MIEDRSAHEPTDYVIWTTWALLALLVGLGIAFGMWAGLHRVTDYRLALEAVGVLGLGTVLIAYSFDRPLVRVFLVIMAAMFVVGYALGGPEFSLLLS